jgi:hypothetical protein
VHLGESTQWLSRSTMSSTRPLVQEAPHAPQHIVAADAIRDLPRLARTYGAGRWRKCKGIATVELATAPVHRVELHWYEAHGIGRKELKIKRYLE